MATISRFEDVDAWQKARVLTREVHVVTAEGAFAKDFGLRDQIRRASVSVMSNRADGFKRGGIREFFHFLFIAKGSAAGVQAQRHVALGAGYIQPEPFKGLCDLEAETGRLIGGFVRYLKTRDAQHGTRNATRGKR